MKAIINEWLREYTWHLLSNVGEDYCTFSCMVQGQVCRTDINNRCPVSLLSGERYPSSAEIVNTWNVVCRKINSRQPLTVGDVLDSKKGAK